MNKKLFGMYLTHLSPFLNSVFQAGIHGDVIEFGVYQGETLLSMAKACLIWNTCCHGVDSFQGLAEPGPQDWPGLDKGHYDVGGPDILRTMIEALGLNNTYLHVGFVPAILHELTGYQFCFAHVDLDHYQPTLDTLFFLLPRISSGGIIMVHDYIPNREGGAAEACREFCQAEQINIEYYEPTNHAILRIF